MNLPSLSILVTCYNQEKYIADCILSCLEQDYAGTMELVIVDDASTDNSVHIIKKLIATRGKDWDISLIIREVNGGVSAAMDTAMAAAKHEWLVWADGDDIQKLDRCSKTAELIRKYPNVVSIHLSRESVGANAVSNGRFLPPMPSRSYKEHPQSYCQEQPSQRLVNYDFSSKNRISDYGCSMAVRRDLYKKWGPLVPEHYVGERFAQDPTWALRAYLSGPALASKYVACKYRSHDSNILNFKKETETLADWKNIELFFSRYASKEAAALEISLADIKKALKNTELTDWNRPQLEALQDILKRRLAMKQNAIGWWDKPVWKRIVISFSMRKHTPKHLLLHLWGRALPLNMYCFLKMLHRQMKKQKR